MDFVFLMLQTEVLITLRDTIIRVANYFYTADPNCMPEDPEFLDELQVKNTTYTLHSDAFWSFLF